MLIIQHLTGPREGQSQQSYKAEIFIGRGPNADIRVDTKHVSKTHACIRFKGGWYEIVDEGSANGIWINQSSSRVEGAYRLRMGDVIRLGGAEGPSMRVSFKYDHARWVQQQAQPADPLPREWVVMALVMTISLIGVVLALLSAL